MIQHFYFNIYIELWNNIYIVQIWDSKSVNHCVIAGILAATTAARLTVQFLCDLSLSEGPDISLFRFWWEW